MAGMLRRLLPPAVLALAGAGLVTAAACGGGGASDEQTTGLTDPSKAVSATPVTGTPASIYQINSDRVVVIAGATTAAAGSSGGGRTHTVVGGDTCSSIATTLNITLEQLLRTNRTINADCSNLRIGEVLRAPSTTPTPGAGATTTAAAGRATATPKPSTGDEYTVREGDICGDIALNFGVEVDDLIALNGLDPDCTDLAVGQVLRIP